MKKNALSKIAILLLFCCIQLTSFAQGREITGTITDAAGEPLPGVNIVIKGTTRGAITNLDGQYTLTATDEDVLVYSFIGYASQETTVGSQSSIDVVLAADLMELDEIVVTGYGVSKKSDITGSVASLKEGDFNQGLVLAPEQLIQGRVPGVQVTSNGGEPGAGVKVKIRGTNTIRSGDMPLYVVDGIPLDMTHTSPDGTDAGAVNPASATNPLNFINPDDIESIDILKDASASAIYGARGANGVVIVTTKKGKEGTSRVNYSAYVGWSKLPKQIDVLGADEFVQFRVDSVPNVDTTQHYGANTNWQDEVYRTAMTQSHSLSYSGGTEKTNYRASFNYLDQEGIIKKSDLNRISGRLNIGQKAINDKLYLEANLTGSQINENRVAAGGTSGYQGDIILNALQANPTMPAYNEDGTPFQPDDPTLYTPIALIEYVKDETKTNRILANLSGTLDIIEGLTYKLNVGFDNSTAVRRINQNQKWHALDTTPEGLGGIAAVNNRELENFLIENYLTYSKSIKQHKFSVMAGYSYQRLFAQGYNLKTQDYATDEILYTYDLESSDNTLSEPSSYGVIDELQSFFGRANYNYMEKYLLTFTYRMDGSSRFGENKKYGHFPSLALAWRVSQESFIKDLNVFNNLKLRLGWGLTGNQEITPKNSLWVVGSSRDATAFMNGVSPTVGYTFLRTPNPEVQWESTEQYNAGLDFGFFKGRLSGTFDWFYKETQDMLLSVPSKQPAPTSTVVSNIEGKIINKGIEIGLTGFIVTTNDIEWSVTANFTKIKNVVKDLPVALIETGRASGRGYTDTRVQVITNDEPINVFYGPHFIGYDSLGHDAFELDTAGNPLDQVLGSPHPDFTYNISSNFRYKNLDLSLNFEGVYGNKIFNNTGNIISRKANLSQSVNVVPETLGTPEAIDNPQVFSDKYIEDGSFLRLSYLTIGYTVPTEKISWLKSLRIYATGTNLLLFTKYKGYDPDVNTDASYENTPSIGIDYTNYPKARTYIIGLNVSF